MTEVNEATYAGDIDDDNGATDDLGPLTDPASIPADQGDGGGK